MTGFVEVKWYRFLKALLLTDPTKKRSINVSNRDYQKKSGQEDKRIFDEIKRQDCGLWSSGQSARRELVLVEGGLQLCIRRDEESSFKWLLKASKGSRGATTRR